ncbi:MAG: DegT/DnrJ/EryC1/StrS family aminotransferase [Gaiellales bacterium]|nr:MAG: DegT/DnrJ/EryC1/StrS family aminotransferase [Gaiellales bacterium]
MKVPYIDLAAEYREQEERIDAAVKAVLASGNYVLGENVAAFEEEFGSWLGGAAVAAVNSGTDAIYLVLKAMGIGPGDEVVTVSHTAVNTVLAVSKVGATPVLVDIEPETFCLDPGLLAGSLTVRTRAIIPVHLYGHPVDMDPVLEAAAERGIPVIEDCAQAHGALYRGRMVGTIGAAACFSFYPTKNLGAAGDAGAVASSDQGLVAKVRSLANCGQGEERYHNVYRGEVSRLDELQAAILRVKLEALDDATGRRRAAAALYRELLAGLDIALPLEREWARHVYHLFVARTRDRDGLLEHLRRAGVGAMVHYPVPVHRQPAYADSFDMALPETDRAVGEIISLPAYPGITPAQQEYVAGQIAAFLRGQAPAGS